MKVNSAVIQYFLQFKELLQRTTVLEEAIKRHEQIAVVVFTILVALGLFSYLGIRKWVVAYIRQHVDAGLRPALDAAEKDLQKVRTQFDERSSAMSRIEEQGKVYLALLKGAAATTPSAPEYMIQFGSHDVTFPDSNYLAMDEPFPKEFPTLPQVFVCEGKPGSWLIVKVDDKDTKRFKWAALNTQGRSNYSTTIQWLAIASTGSKAVMRDKDAASTASAVAPAATQPGAKSA